MKRLLLSAGLLAGICSARAQVPPASDTSLLMSAVRAARQRYQATAPEPRLVNGVAYGNQAPSYVTGRPFFQSSDPQPGTLDYDGQYFEDVELLYEQVLDQVLLYGSAQAQPVQLVRQKVREFDLVGHHFVHLPADAAGVVVDGFYEVLVAGPARLLARRTKKLEANTGGYGMKGEYEETTRFFIQQPTGFYEVASLRQALVALADKRAELQAHARRNHLRLAADSREASLAALVREYNALSMR